MKILISRPHFELLYDSDNECLLANWDGIHGSDYTQECYRLLLEQVMLTGSTKLLNDCLLDKDGWQRLTDWLAHKYFIELASQGLLAIAWVLPRHIPALYDTMQLLSKVTRPVVDVFSDTEAACVWLSSSVRQAK